MKRCIQTLSIICLALYFCIGTALAAVPVPHQTKETIVFDDGTYLEIVTTVEPSLTQSNTKKASKEQFGCCSIYNTRVIGFYYVKNHSCDIYYRSYDFFCSCLHRAVGI